MKNLFLIIGLVALAILLPATVSAYGNISVSSSPVGAEIYLNGISTSLYTPSVVESVPAGTNNITLVLSGYATYVWSAATVMDNETTTLSAGTLTPLTSSVSFESYPAGAQVYLDNVYIGYSNISGYTVGYGSRTVLMQLTGYDGQTQTIVVDSSSQTVTSTFASPFVNGSIYFTTSPSYADIYLDSVYTGTTPLTVYNVTPGSYSVKYYRPGYTNWSDSVTVTAGVEQDVYAALTASTTTTETTAVTAATTSPTAVPVAAAKTCRDNNTCNNQGQIRIHGPHSLANFHDAGIPG
ncbi:MAG: PEGA domain-containing protein [Methanoregula sp.]|jgi:hypothetical protein